MKDSVGELANSLSHGLGLLISLVAVPILVASAVQSNSTYAVIGGGVFGFTLLFMFTSSTLYHTIQHPETKKVMQKLDHISIYFLIAGTYTPFLLLFINNTLGMLLLGLQWSLVIFGIVYKTFWIGKYRKLSLAIYLLMGWAAVLAGRSFVQNLPLSCLILVVIGGMLYTVGVVFYRWESLRGHHLIWHLFVLFASFSHYAAVLFAVNDIGWN